MKWIELKASDQVQEIKNESIQGPVLVFKHSYRCNISRAALDRLERNWNENEMSSVKSYFLDLLSNRKLSDEVAEVFKVEHESPQILLIDDGQPILNLSHFEIDYHQIKAAINS